MQDLITALLNIGGITLQIEGLIIGGYAVRKLVFTKKGTFQPGVFQKDVFQTSTTPDSAPTDKKTKKK